MPFTRASMRLRKKSALGRGAIPQRLNVFSSFFGPLRAEKCCFPRHAGRRAEGLPQRLKPNSSQSIYVRPEGRTLQENEFFRKLKPDVIIYGPTKSRALIQNMSTHADSEGRTLRPANFPQSVKVSPAGKFPASAYEIAALAA